MGYYAADDFWIDCYMAGLFELGMLKVRKYQVTD